MIIEPVQGDGGFLPAGPAFMQALRRITSQHGILLICDEIQSGFGRTGTMFAFQQLGIKPDLVTLAKSLGGGLPISGVVGRAEIIGCTDAWRVRRYLWRQRTGLCGGAGGTGSV